MLADHHEEVALVEIEVDLVEVEIEADLVEEVVAGVALEIEVEVEEDLEEVTVDVEEVVEGDVVEEVDEVVVEEVEAEEEDLSSRKVALTSPELTRLCRSLWRGCRREPRFLSLSSTSPQWGQSKGIKNPRNQEFGFTRTRKLKWYKQFHLFCIF